MALSLSPLLPSATPLYAEAPVTRVTGLAQGARGDAVKTLQQALVNQGIAVSGGVDGIFGPGTEAALKQFQEQKGLAASGAVDDATALALGLASSAVLGLAQGTRGDAVRSLQQALVDHGLALTGGVDGIFGAATTSAVKQFQQQQGLAASGTVDAPTAAALGTVSAGPAPASSAAGAAGGASLVGLRIGARGDAVKDLQQQLVAAGFEVVGGVDGIFGVLTANALSSFQYSVGITANAVVNDATAAALADKAGGAAGAHDPAATSSLAGLAYGASGPGVKQLQQTLLDAGVAVRGGADGVFGTATQAALKQYQEAVGVAVTGVVDDATASALGSGRRVGSASPMLGLRAGALGATVKQLQQALIDAGVTVRGGADGIFGPATAGALQQFQTSQGLSATGVVDDATAAALASPRPAVAAAAAGDGWAAYGEKGSRVTALQSALVRAGIAVRGGVDGDFGSGTSAAVMEFQRQHGLSVTGKVDQGTAAALGLAAGPAPAAPDPTTVRLEAFPVQGLCYFGDTWQYSRGGGRSHLGVDIIASRGQMIYAATSGTITKTYADYPGSLSGNGVRLTAGDGTYFFYAHMDSLAPGIQVGTRVAAGQIIGYVGATGNAGTTHLHFEVHPQGGSAVNPYPLVRAIDACSTTAPPPQP